VFNDLLNPQQSTAVAHTESVVYLLVVTLLSTSSLAYLLSRLGFFYRAKSHHRASRAALDEFFEGDTPRLTVLVPSYQEDARVIRNTLLSVGLQEYPDMRVVLLIDDPVAPRDRRGRELLEAARALPGEIQELLAWPASRSRDALARFEATGLASANLGPDAVAELAAQYDAAASWLDELATGQDLVDHTDAFFANHILRRLARDLATVGGALRQAADEGALLPGRRALQLYRRLAWTFHVEMSSFERKKYVSLSREPNKAMNLNSYIGLMGGEYREVATVAGPALVAAGPGEASLSIPDPDYVVTVDADSILLPEYCLRLVHILEQQEHRQDAIAQTPYSAFPGSATRLERVAGATTDLQHLVHQGLTYYDATFWVGANAVIRKRALDDILDRSYLGDWEIRTYIKDRTPIEDTDSTLDMGIHGWRLFNVPERLSYSATPPDFGSLSIQRQRWATGGLLIVPKLRHRARAARRRGERVRFSEKFMRWNYMASITWSSLSLLVLLAFPFNSTLISPLLGVIAFPYFWAMTLDLRYCGYKRLDIARVYGFNLLLIPINLAGATATLVQAITASKGQFMRTPKVRNRTVTPILFVVTPYLLAALAAFTCYESYRHRVWENMAYAAVNLLLLSYAIVAFIGLGNSFIDALAHLKSFVFTTPASQSRRRWFRRTPQQAPVMDDWRSVLDLGGQAEAAVPGVTAGKARTDGSLVPGSWRLPSFDEFWTVFQPVVDLSSGEVVGYEALTRFDDGTSAERWLAEAVAAGDGVALEGMMARSALDAALALPEEGWLAIKASTRLLRSDTELRRMLASLERPLLVEVTEPSTSDVMPELRDLRGEVPGGTLIAIEHAGLGHKSQSVLLDVRPAYIKLDRAAVAGLADDDERQAQFANLIAAAKSCGCTVVVTGVETEQQRELFARLGAHLGQGYLFGRPEQFDVPETRHSATKALITTDAVARSGGAASRTGPAQSRGGSSRIGVPGAPDGPDLSSKPPRQRDVLDLSAEEERRRPRLSLLRLVAVLAVIGGAAYGLTVKVPQAVQAASASKSATWFAPYVDATLTPTYAFQDRSADSARQVVLGFVVSQPGSGCTPSWGGYYTLEQADQALALGPRVAELAQQGVGAIVSFGGQANTDLAVGCTDTQDLERAYQSVVSYYGVRTIDFDVEGPALSTAAAQRRAAAVAELQANAARRHQQIRVWLTLPVEPDGLQANAITTLNAMLRARVVVAGVNIMTMDFTAPPAPGQTMLGLSLKAANATHHQLQQDLARYGVRLSSEEVWQRMGITAMVGQNDVAGEVFTTADAQGLARFASSNSVGRVSMWSLNRDSQCGQAFGESGVLSNTCSGTAQGSLGFSQIFGSLGGLASHPAGSGPTILAPPPDTNPANALYPLWSPTAEYQPGYLVVRSGYVYQANWYNVGQDPAQVWPETWENPWELVGPVLPTDHTPKIPTLPAGTYPAWSPTAAYNAGEKVLYQGLPYQARWYTAGASPAEQAADPSGSPWQPLFTIPGEPAGTS
jgi:EAL domain-containing protein (putative c-di-GMP-specific phosphodiesterase class I)/cellulose synthase/poly-beta-1,6-N-acetylglucosamine synthase-like glycosyltransferase/chitodextrinase